MPNVATAYARLRTSIGRLEPGDGFSLEPKCVVQTAHDHRMFWRPNRIRVLLLAESHVFTTSSENAERIHSPGIPPAVPERFVRLVYCLGYGEDGLLDGPVSNNGGTPQYWKLLAACVRNPQTRSFCSDVLKTGNPNQAARVRAKLGLLRELRRRGVWLLDASPIALYGVPEKPSGPVKESVLGLAWNA